jgi:hypothetical protein
MPFLRALCALCDDLGLAPVGNRELSASRDPNGQHGSDSRKCRARERSADNKRERRTGIPSASELWSTLRIWAHSARFRYAPALPWVIGHVAGMVPVDIWHVPFAFMPEHDAAAPLAPEVIPGHDAAPAALHCAFVIGHVPVDPAAVPPIIRDEFRLIIPTLPCAAAIKTSPITARLAAAIPMTTLFRVLTIHTPCSVVLSEKRVPAPRESLVSTACRHLGDRAFLMVKISPHQGRARDLTFPPRSRAPLPYLVSWLLCGGLVSSLVFSVCIYHLLAHPARVRYSSVG